MSRNGQEGTPVSVELYLRTADGDCFYVDNLQEAVDVMASHEGYRLSVYTPERNGPEIVIHRFASGETQFKDLVFDAELTLRGHKNEA